MGTFGEVAWRRSQGLRQNALSSVLAAAGLKGAVMLLLCSQIYLLDKMALHLEIARVAPII